MTTPSTPKPSWYEDLTPEEQAIYDALNAGEGFMEEGETVAVVVPRTATIRAGEWNEEAHPRHPAGSPEGGEFASTGGDTPAHLRAKKGDAVYYISSWDNKGTWRVRRFTVGSWGKKQAHLINGDGTNLEQRIYVQHVNTGPTAPHLFRVADVADPKATALALAEKYLVAERARIERLIASNPDTYGYHKAMRDKLAELHEPRILMPGDAD